MSTLPGVPLAVGVMLLLAACEYPGVPHPLAAQAGNQVPPAPSATREPSAVSSPGQGAKEAGPAEATVRVSLKDFELDPNKLAAKGGTVTFVLKNEGRYTHDFRVEGQGIDDRAPKVGQGRTFEWQATLPPGAYRISCPISNHADRGMVGTLDVVP